MFTSYAEYDLLHTRKYLLLFENFGLGSLHHEYVGLAGAKPQFNSVAPYSFVDELIIFCREMEYFP
jgi:hypothetical protein